MSAPVATRGDTRLQVGIAPRIRRPRSIAREGGLICFQVGVNLVLVVEVAGSMVR